MSFSNYLEKAALDHIFNKAALTAPTIYIALLTATPTDASTGSTITEPSGNAYARKVTAAADWNVATTPGGTTTNLNALSFVAATGSWGTITHFALVDASSAGNMLAWGVVTPSQAVVSGNTVTFDAGTLSVALD